MRGIRRAEAGKRPHQGQRSVSRYGEADTIAGTEHRRSEDGRQGGGVYKRTCYRQAAERGRNSLHGHQRPLLQAAAQEREIPEPGGADGSGSRIRNKTKSRSKVRLISFFFITEECFLTEG